MMRGIFLIKRNGRFEWHRPDPLRFDYCLTAGRLTKEMFGDEADSIRLGRLAALMEQIPNGADCGSSAPVGLDEMDARRYAGDPPRSRGRSVLGAEVTRL
jgi:hypothetical protein